MPEATAALRGLLPSLDQALDKAPATLSRTPAAAADISALVPTLRMALADLNPMLAFLVPYGRDIAGLIANGAQVANAVGLNSALMTGSRVVGPALAGVLIPSKPYRRQVVVTEPIPPDFFSRMFSLYVPPLETSVPARRTASAPSTAALAFASIAVASSLPTPTPASNFGPSENSMPSLPEICEVSVRLSDLAPVKKVSSFSSSMPPSPESSPLSRRPTLPLMPMPRA